MSDAQWIDVDADISEAVEHFRRAIELRRSGDFGDLGIKGYRDRMALMHAMQSGHTSAEAALGRILRILREEPPTGDDWHRTLVRRLAKAVRGSNGRPALLTAEVAADLDETRSFRHRAMHSYSQFDVTRAEPAFEAAIALLPPCPTQSPGLRTWSIRTESAG